MESPEHLFAVKQSVDRLDTLLNSNLFKHQLKRGLSLVLECLFYLLFLVGLIAIVLLPFLVDGLVEGNTDSDKSLRFSVIGQLVLAFFVVPAPFFALLLRRNRKKNELIRKAFEEVSKMREDLK